MFVTLIVVAAVVVVVLLIVASCLRVVREYERGVHFRLGRVIGVKQPGLRVIDPVKSVVVIESVTAAINQIAQTTLRNVVGQHSLDDTLSETDRINADIREILEVTAVDRRRAGDGATRFSWSAAP